MVVVIVTAGYETSFECEVANLRQLTDFLQNNKKEVWEKVKDKQLTYTVCDKVGNGLPLYPGMQKSDITSYELLVIAEKLEGQALFSSIAAAVAAAVSAAVGGSAVVGTVAGITITAGVIGTTVAAIAVVGLAFALGAIMQALSPTAEVSGDSSQKNYMFNGIPNVQEQGGSVPLFFGEGYFGGVVIGLVLDTLDMSVSGTLSIDDDIETIAAATIKDATQSTWYRAE
jgi:predicted phage tail protein